MKWLLPILILTGLCFCMGCTQTQEISTPNVTAVPTLLNTTIPTPTATPMPVRAIVTATPIPEWTPEEEPVPDWTEAPVVIPTANPDTTSYNFTQFTSDDFMAKYPERWAVVCQTFIIPDVTILAKDMWKTEGRMVTFTSEDGKVKMMVSVRDFIQPGPNRFAYTPTIDSARKSVAAIFPNASSETSVYNFEFKKNEQQISTSKYDVIFIPDSEYYPYTYTEETWITYNHLFNVDFIVNNGMSLNDYRELKYTMMKSVLTEGNQVRKWW